MHHSQAPPAAREERVLPTQVVRLMARGNPPKDLLMTRSSVPGRDDWGRLESPGWASQTSLRITCEIRRGTPPDKRDNS